MRTFRYLGLLGLHKLMKQHPRVVSEHKDLILDCLNDDDVTIRMRALDLITGMVSQRNLQGIVRRLIEHLDTSEGTYRDNVLERIVFICSQEDFAFISDFEWYIGTLVDLTHLEGTSKANGVRVTQQIIDVVVRVPEVRKYGVRSMCDLLLSKRLLPGSATFDPAMCEVLHAAAFLVGEYAEYVKLYAELVEVMLLPEISSLSVEVQNVFVQNVMKVMAMGLLTRFEGAGG